MSHGEAQWNEFTADDADTSPATEEPMSDRTDTTEPAAPAATEAAMPTKKTPRTKRPAKKAAAKAKKTKTTKPAKVKKERPPKEDLCVFACRVAEAERVKFHEATGPGGATRFARKLMVVFSNEDESGFRALLKEAKEARG